MDTLLKEARDDIGEIKNSLASIDKSLGMTMMEIKTVKKETHEISTKVDSHEKHINFEKTALKFVFLIGGFIVFIAEVTPLFDYIKKLF